jgi:ABC-type multidrug transport system ATPase subunit
LAKSYGDKHVVGEVSFDVEKGEVFALLGPNGAGKTTTIEILEGFRKRTGGEVTTLGVDPAVLQRLPGPAPDPGPVRVVPGWGRVAMGVA